MRESGKQTGVKYAQFSLVGGSNALVDVGVLNLLLLISPTRSPEVLVVYNVVALVLTNANSYLWNTLWTFRGRARHDARQVGLFTAQGLLNVTVGGGPYLAAGPRARRPHGPLAAGRGKRRQAGPDGGRLDHELRVAPLLRLPQGGTVIPDRKDAW